MDPELPGPNAIFCFVVCFYLMVAQAGLGFHYIDGNDFEIEILLPVPHKYQGNRCVSLFPPLLGFL